MHVNIFINNTRQDGGSTPPTSTKFIIQFLELIKREAVRENVLLFVLFKIYTIVYGVFDKIIHALDQDAYKVKTFPNWFMTLLSLYGLGFQLLIIAIMLPLGWIEFIVPFFIAYTTLIFGLIGIRKIYLK